MEKLKAINSKDLVLFIHHTASLSYLWDYQTIALIKEVAMMQLGSKKLSEWDTAVLFHLLTMYNLLKN